jgi:hypothetical protein
MRKLIVVIGLLLLSTTVGGAGLQAPFGGSRVSSLTRPTTIFETDGTTSPTNSALWDKTENRFYYSDDIGNTTGALWKTSGTPDVIATRNYARAPDGTLTATLLTSSGASTGGRWEQGLDILAVPSVGTVMTFSIYMRVDGPPKYIDLLIRGIEPDARPRFLVTNKWKRYSYSAVTTAAAASRYPSMAIYCGTYFGTYSSVYVWRAQGVVNVNGRTGMGPPISTGATNKPPYDLTAAGTLAYVSNKAASQFGDRRTVTNYNGTTTYHSKAHHASMNMFDTDFTITVITCPSSTAAADGTVFGHSSGTAGMSIKWVNASTQYAFQFGGPSGLTSRLTGTTPKDGSCYILQGSRSGNTFSSYINGVALATLDVTNYGTDANLTLYVGDGADGKYAGTVAYARVDASALNSEELTNDREVLMGLGRSNNTKWQRPAHRLDGTTGYYSCTDAACGSLGLEPTGDFSIQCQGVVYAAGNYGLLSKWETTGNQGSYDLHISNTGEVQFYTTSNGSSFTIATKAAAIVAGTPFLITVAYDYVADGSSICNIYVNSLTVGTSNVMKGPVYNSTAPFEVGAEDTGTNKYPGDISYCSLYNGVFLSSANHTAAYTNVRYTGDPNHESLGLTPTFFNRFKQDPSGATITTDSGHVLTRNGIISQVYLSPELYGWQFTRTTAAWMKLPAGGASVAKPSIVKVASGVPRVPDGILLEPQATNLQTYSEEMNRFTLNNAFSSVGTDATIALDGTTTAESWTAIADGTDPLERYMYNSSAIAITNATAYTYSIFVRRGTNLRWIGLDFNTNFAGRDPVSFDLRNGVIGTQGAGSTGQIEPYGDDWYRIGITATSTAAATSTDVIRIYMQDGDNDRTLSGTGAVEYYMWGGGLEARGYMTSYIQTVAGSVTRNGELFYLPVHMGDIKTGILPSRLHPTDKSKLTMYVEQKCNEPTTAYFSTNIILSVSGNTGTASATRNLIRIYMVGGVLTVQAYGDTGGALLTQVLQSTTHGTSTNCLSTLVTTLEIIYQ